MALALPLPFLLLFQSMPICCELPLGVFERFNTSRYSLALVRIAVLAEEALLL